MLDDALAVGLPGEVVVDPHDSGRLVGCDEGVELVELVPIGAGDHRCVGEMGVDEVCHVVAA